MRSRAVSDPATEDMSLPFPFSGIIIHNYNNCQRRESGYNPAQAEPESRRTNNYIYGS
jgi:hypothetical protein